MEIGAMHGFSFWVKQDFHRNRLMQCIVVNDFQFEG
jgi:hypothetical protein